MDNRTVTEASNYFDLQGLERLRQKTKTNDKETIREVANQFESMFAAMLIKSMRQANEAFETESPFNNQQTKFYTEMQDKQLALDISRHGTLGLADALVRQLDPTSIQRPQAIPEDQLMMPNVDKSKDFSLKEEDEKSQDFNKPDQLQASVRGSNQEAGEKAKTVDFSSPSSFIQTLLPYAKKAAKALGVSPEAIIAQSALETGWGQKIIKKSDQQSSFNLFNIKSQDDWQGESVNKSSLEVEDGIGVQRKSNFRVYQNLQESFKDYINFITNNQRYDQALQQNTNADRYIEELQEAGYATDPHYAEKIKNIMNSDTFKSIIAGENNNG